MLCGHTSHRQKGARRLPPDRKTKMGGQSRILSTPESPGRRARSHGMNPLNLNHSLVKEQTDAPRYYACCYRRLIRFVSPVEHGRVSRIISLRTCPGSADSKRFRRQLFSNSLLHCSACFVTGFLRQRPQLFEGELTVKAVCLSLLPSWLCGSTCFPSRNVFHTLSLPVSRFQLGEADNTSVNRRVKGWH
jgi:hypothetical protein